MKSLLLFALFVFLLVLLLFFGSKVIDSLGNMWHAIWHGKKPPYHEGMVYNKETELPEADNSMMHPFK